MPPLPYIADAGKGFFLLPLVAKEKKPDRRLSIYSPCRRPGENRQGTIRCARTTQIAKHGTALCLILFRFREAGKAAKRHSQDGHQSRRHPSVLEDSHGL